MPSSYTIGERYERLARELVKSGRFASVSEVLRDGLRLVEEREERRVLELDAIRAEIAEGMKGPFEDWDAEDVKVKGREILAKRSKSNVA